MKPNKIVREFLDTIKSLNTAITDAGGTCISATEIEAMSAVDLLCLIAPNDIRFVCTHPVPMVTVPSVEIGGGR